MSVSITDLEFSYPGAEENPFLKVPEWRVETGEKVFLQGPSGSGKSTLLNILCGMLPVKTGEVSLFGHRLDQMNSRQRDRFRAGNIGYVFQQFNLIPYLNVMDNILVARQFNRGGKGSHSRSDIEDFLRTLNIGEEQWHKPARALSIGQQQRVAIARAFVNRPSLLIVDEPTSSLDHANRDDFMQLLMDRVAETKATLLFVSHDISLAGHFSRVDSIYGINHGDVAADIDEEAPA